MTSQPFDAATARAHAAPARASAAAAVPLVLDRLGPVRSVVDFGCGAGQWLAEFIAQGVEDVTGLEGGHPSESDLLVPADVILTRDLTQPVDLGRRFDLAVSLEVGEHLPAHAAEVFVRSLCAASDTVLFGAAVPHQNGSGHIHCQPQSWWAGLFAAEGYQVFDPFRPLWWGDPRIEWWYQQDTLVYSSRPLDLPRPVILDVTHPGLVEAVLRERGTVTDEARRLGTVVTERVRAKAAVRTRLGLR